MTKLYIIGNGFDLWQGLPTSYDLFYEYAKETLDELESYFHIDTAQSGPWYDFENSLGVSRRIQSSHNEHRLLSGMDYPSKPATVPLQTIWSKGHGGPYPYVRRGRTPAALIWCKGFRIDEV